MLYYYIKIKEDWAFSWTPFSQDGKVPIFCDEDNAKKQIDIMFSKRCMIMPISYLPTEEKSCLYKRDFVIMDSNSTV